MTRRDHRRFDFVVEVLSANEATGQVELFLRPDPRRYEWREREGTRLLYDKYDDLYLPEDVFSQFAKQAAGMPITYDSGKLEAGGAPKYIASRRYPVAESLDMRERRGPYHLADKSEEFLEHLAGNELGFVIMSVDVVGSTQLANSLAPEDYRAAMSTLLFELSETVPLFNGQVLKYTGDGLIAYFPEPSFMRKADLAIDCALTLRGLVQDAINPALDDRGLPTIALRIGLDAGEAFVEVVGSPQTKRHADLIGDVVSLASEVRTCGGAGWMVLHSQRWKTLPLLPLWELTGWGPWLRRLIRLAQVSGYEDPDPHHPGHEAEALRARTR